MLTPERHGGLKFATVHADRIDDAIVAIKEVVPSVTHGCSACEYEAEVRRWGIKTYDTKDPTRIALVLCCPSCETYTGLPVEAINEFDFS